MRKIFPLVVLVVAVLAMALSACVQSGVKMPEPVGYVSDFAQILTSSERLSLEAKLNGYAQNTSNEITIVTIGSLGGLTIEQYTIALAEKWKVGKKSKDNGVILLVAKGDRKLRIEVGYGLEGVLTDVQSKLIIEREIVPYFKKEEFGKGISAGVDAIIGTIGGSYTPTPLSREGKSNGVSIPPWLLLALVFGGIVVVAIFVEIARGSGGRSWSSGGGGYHGSRSGGSRSGGGGGRGFGGGGFGGGGASGGW